MIYTGTICIFVKGNSYTLICQSSGGFRVLEERGNIDRTFIDFDEAHKFVLETIENNSPDCFKGMPNSISKE